jgi:hypothetical protein
MSSAGSANDPLGIISPTTTAPITCILSNIASRPALNGTFCQALEFTNGRYTVVLFNAKDAAAGIVNGTASPQPQYLKIQPSSLAKASQIDQMRLSAAVAYETMKLFANHEAVVNVGRRLTPSPLRGRISPKQTLSILALLIGVLFLFMGYLVGFSKLLVGFSLLALLLVVSSPDWMRGMKEKKRTNLVIRQSFKNLGSRWKEMLVHSTGYNVSDKIAAGSLVLIVLWTAKILLTPSNRGAPIRQAGPSVASPKYDLEFIYKLGYEDGKSGDVFGASLPSDVMTSNTDSTTTLDWDAYDPQPLPRQSRPNLGMGTLLSMFALFRFGKDLVTHPDGSVIRDPNLIVMKLKALEPWRLGLMFMSLYRVVSAFSALFRY